MNRVNSRSGSAMNDDSTINIIVLIIIIIVVVVVGMTRSTGWSLWRQRHLEHESRRILRELCALYVVQNENADLTQQIDNLQKKLSDCEAADAKASEQYKQLQQENDNSVTKLKGVNIIDGNTAPAFSHY